MRNGMHVRLIKLRKGHACGNLEDAEILLHYAIGPRFLFIEGQTIREGGLLQDINVGGPSDGKELDRRRCRESLPFQ